MVFPVIHSTLDPKALTREVQSRYALHGDVRCQLISRANNDFYEVTTGGDRFALRVSKANFRSRDEYAFEAEYVLHLHSKGCLVPAPIKTRDGDLFFEVEAPEGIRTVTLMHWLGGRPFKKTLTSDDAFDVGAALARLHSAGEDFESAYDRTISTPDILDERIPDLLSLLEGDQEQCRFYVDAKQKVNAAYAAIDHRAVRRGPVHGDFQFANVMRAADGTLPVLDFDTCGIGYVMEDLYTFVWRSDMEIKDEAVNRAFFTGYESERALTVEEKRNGALFRLARDLVMSSSYAILINRVGPVPGFDGDFQPFTDLAQKHLAEAGLA